MDKGRELVLHHDASGDSPNRDTHVLVADHGRVQVEIGDVEAAVGGAGSGDGAVDDYFGGGEVSSGRADVARVVNLVATGGEADAVGFSLLGSMVDYDAEVGCLAAFG